MKKSRDIYERKGVYGDIEKFNSSYNRLDKMLHLVDSLPFEPKTILDIGCGTGTFAYLMKKRFPKAVVIGADISTTALSIGRKNYKSIQLVLANAEKKLPFRPNYFDLVVSGEHIEHLVDVDTYLEELNRVLKKDGYLLLTTPNLASWINRLLLLFGFQPWYLEASYRKNLPIFSIGTFRFPINSETPAVGHLRLFTLNILKKLLHLYGFDTEAVLGTKIMMKPAFKQLDLFFSYIPSLAFGLIILAKKI